MKNKNEMKRLFAYNPTLPQAWGLVALVILIQIVSGLVVEPFIPSNGYAQSWHLLLSYVLCFILVIFIVMQMGKSAETSLPPTPSKGGGEHHYGVRSTKYSTVVNRKSQIVILLLFFILTLAILIEPLYVWIPMPEWIKQIFEAAFKNDIPTFLSAAVAAPFAEEWLCRGVILKGLLTHYSPRKAIIWSAVLFGVLHMNPWQAIPAFCLALAIGWIYWRTQSLWPCIFMHAVNNSLAFLMLIMFPDAASDTTTIDVVGTYYGLVYAVALLCCTLTGYGLWRMLPKNYLVSDR